jgi:hypothetical protein
MSSKTHVPVALFLRCSVDLSVSAFYHRSGRPQCKHVTYRRGGCDVYTFFSNQAKPKRV